MENIITIDGIPVTIDKNVGSIDLHLHRTISDPPEVRIKLSKMSKGYQWEISSEGPDPNQVTATLESTDKMLRAKYEPTE